ncbi:MAG: ABC transporter ATP-binding protein, partial [Treponemataceae bacterium]|nr:ABC transporter ATP-binding protein [Treponemataceae bacterium]
KKYSKENNVPVFIAMHELDLSRKYADNVLLFYPDRRIDFGTPEEVLTKDALEEAYGVPAAMLRDTENLNRNALKEASDAMDKIK